MLFWILVPTAIIAIYFARVHDWDSNFISNGSTQSGTVNKTWFSFFQVMCKPFLLRIYPHMLWGQADGF